MRGSARGRALVVRLDSDGDVLLAGPAVRAVAAGSEHVTLLVSPQGEQAARLLPGVDEVVVWPCPWTGFAPVPVDPASTDGLVGLLRAARIDVAVVLTSFHQSSLPIALLLRLAGVARIVAVSVDYPGSLLDVRLAPHDGHEVEAALAVAAAAGFHLPAGDGGGLRVEGLPAPTPAVTSLGRYLVVHPSASVPARSPSPERTALMVAALSEAGHRVVLTGAPGDARLPLPSTGPVAGQLLDLTGRTTFAELAAVLAGADCVVSPNTGPAHLAAAVGTPVVALFAPVVPAARWRPWQVPTVLLGDQAAPCAGSRARTCPVPGHPCLDGIDPAEVVRAVDTLVPRAVVV